MGWVMNNLTITEVSKVTAITGIAKIRTPEGELQDLKVGDVLQPGTVVLLADASVFLFEPSMLEAGSAIAELPADQQPAMPAMGAAGGEGGQTLAQINAMQQAILSGQDPTQAFEAAAAGVAADAGGGGPGSGNDGFISIDRVGDSTIASAGYDTTAFTGADIQIPELTSSVPENAPTLVTPDVNTVSEDNPATGNVLANDSDADDVLTVGSFVVGGTAYAAGDTATLNGIGTVVINPDGSYVFTPVANWNGVVPEVTYTTNTGASSTLNIEVTAINDNAQIIGTSSGTTVEAGGVNNGTLGDNFADGTLTVADNDTGENTFAPVSGAALNGTYGTFTFDTATGYWTYTLDNGRTATQALNAGDGVSDSLTVSSLDGTDSQVITVNITGSNDNAQITGIATGDVTEDVGVSAGHLTTSGSLDVADVDEGEAVFQTPASLTGSNGYGVFTFNPANGDWTYSADNSQSAIQGLKNGESLTDSLTVTSLDGTANQVITVTIHGTNDAPVLDLDANDSAATGYNYATSYTANSAPVAIADVDSLITDLDSTTLSGATITLANSQIGDLLSASGIPAGLGITATVNNNVVTLSGAASLASYSAAIEAITFSTTNNTVTDNRVINVVVYDDAGAPSNTATTTISVLTSPISYEDDDTGWQMNKSPNSDTFQMRAKGGKITLLQGGTIYWDILVNDSNHDASISFALGKFDESMAASYEKLYDADGQMIFRVYVTAIDSTVLAADDQFGITVNNADGDMLLLNSDEFVRPHSNYNVDYSDPNTFDTGTVGDSSADNDWLSTYALDGSDVNGGEFSTGTLFTQPGVTQHYGSMDDIAYGTVGNDQLYGDAGNDFIAGRAGNDILHGGDGNDTLVGGYGNDELHGDSGNDKLYGNENNDILIGGQGDDILTGGDGIDTFTWTADDVASGPFTDTITDFSISATDGDKLDLSAVLTGVEADLDNYLQIVSDGAGNAEISVYKNGDALSSTPPSPDMTIIIEGHGGSDAELEALKTYLETDGGLIH